MKNFKNLFATAFISMFVFAGFMSCTEDNEPSKGTIGNGNMPVRGAIVLNEGSYNKNNASLMCFNWEKDTIAFPSLFNSMNGRGLGDTGQDIIVDGNSVYIVVYGSNYIAKLNREGKEVVRYDFNVKKELGSPRYMVVDGDYLYVTCYGGYVAKLLKSTLNFVECVKVGDNPDGIAVLNGKIYCMNTGMENDNRMSIIDIKDFSKGATHVTIFQNPTTVIACGDKLLLQGYGGKYPDYTYPLQVYNQTTGKRTDIGQATNVTTNKNMVYYIYSNTDWNTYTTINTYHSYNITTNEKTDDILKNAPKEVYSSHIYGINVNPSNGHIYVLTTKFSKGDGIIYHFDQDGKYITSFSSYGQNPRKIVFFNK